MALVVHKLCRRGKCLFVHLATPFHSLLHVEQFNASLVNYEELVWVLDLIVLLNFLIVFNLFYLRDVVIYFCWFTEEIGYDLEAVIDDCLALVLLALQA